MTHIALLRGINVGGNNIIRMAALKALFERMGFADVKTYIQSGNVIFSSPITNTKTLSRAIEKALSKEFRYVSRVLVVSEKEITRVMKEAPKGFGSKPAHYRYDVIFLFPELSSKKAFAAMETREGVDWLTIGAHALYSSRLIKKATQSRMAKVIMKPEYKLMTIRNWNTTKKLAGMVAKDT